MPAGTVSARPDALVQFLVAAVAPATAVVGIGPPLDAAVHRARVGGLFERLSVSATLGSRLVRHAHEALASGRATAVTGIAFANAGGSSLAGLGRWLAGADDEEVAAFVAGLLGLPVDGASVTPSLVDPDVVAEAVAGLSSAQLARLAAEHPLLVGPVDGMPVHLRYAANRVLLAETVAGYDASGMTVAADHLRGLLREGHQILYFDPAGDGRIAEVHGDLLTADNIAVVVPGMGNDLLGFQGPTTEKARNLFEGADGRTAVIAWLGYDSPDGADAVFDAAALDGADALVRLFDGLPDDALRTVVGHSYGTVVTAAALRRGLDVDQIVVTGSPGMFGDTAREVAGPIPVFAARAPGDGISWSENFGRDPSDPRFGATRFDTGNDIALHSDYFEEGTESLTNITRIVTGHAGDITVIEPGLIERLVNIADDIDRLVSDPIDDYQEVAQEVFDVAWSASDALESVLPGPIADGLDAYQHLEGSIFEVGNRGVDLWQRVHSPDFLGDVALDGWDLVHDHLDDVAREVGGIAVDAGEVVIDAGGEVLGTAGDVLETAGDLAGDVAGGIADGAGAVVGLFN